MQCSHHCPGKSLCVSPLDLYVRTEHSIKESYAQQKTKLNHYVEKILPQAKNWIMGRSPVMCTAQS